MTKLLVAIGRYPHTALLKDGAIDTGDLELEFAEIPDAMPATFRKMVRETPYDVAEMAITTYLSAKEYHKAFTAIPVFPVREFPHRALSVNTEAGITDPKQLEGKRVGVRAYTVTTGVWARGVLADQYGVDLEKVTWVIADEEHVLECQLPGNVESMPGADLTAMLAAGELQAGISIGRADTPNVKPLLTDRAEKEKAWAARGIYPINHTIVVKDSVIAEDPKVAAALFQAFSRSKAPLMERMNSGATLEAEEQHIADRRPLVGPDPLPYGIEANRATLEAIVGFARAQHILSADLSVEDMFVPGSEA